MVIKVATNGTYHKISIVKPTRCTSVSNLFYFGITLHVSDGHSIRHQDFTTVHTATKQILLLLASKQTAVSVWLLYVQSWNPDDGRKDRPKHVELFQNKINLRHWCIWLVLLLKYFTMHGPMNVKHHKMYANTSWDPQFAPIPINFSMLCYECTSRYLELLSPALLYSDGSYSKIDR